MLQIVDFQKKYGRCVALQIDNLEISSGIYWIRGINGSGKSTFLKAIAGIISFEGNIILNSQTDIKKQPVSYRKLVNFAEAEPIFPDFLTGREMIRLFSSAKGTSKNQPAYYIESMHMQSYIDDAVGTYSSGMLKKLSLILAFMGNPALILLDEPLITIDAESLKILYNWIIERQKQEGTSFLLSSHQSLETDYFPDLQTILVEQQTIKYNPDVSTIN